MRVWVEYVLHCCVRLWVRCVLQDMLVCYVCDDEDEDDEDARA